MDNSKLENLFLLSWHCILHFRLHMDISHWFLFYSMKRNRWNLIWKFLWNHRDFRFTLYRRVTERFTFPDWYFSRIGRIQRLPPLWKLNPAMQILNYCKFVGLFDSKKISINICHEFWLAGWNRTTIGHIRNYSYLCHNLYWSIIGQAQRK